MNRAERRCLAREARQGKTRPEAAPVASAEAGFASRRTMLLALGLRLDANDTFWGTSDEARELKPHLDRLYAAVGVLGAPDALGFVIEELGTAFTREWTSESARRYAAAVLAYNHDLLAFADAFDATKAEVDRLKAKKNTPVGSTNTVPPGPETAAP